MSGKDAATGGAGTAAGGAGTAAGEAGTAAGWAVGAAGWTKVAASASGALTGAAKLAAGGVEAAAGAAGIAAGTASGTPTPPTVSATLLLMVSGMLLVSFGGLGWLLRGETVSAALRSIAVVLLGAFLFTVGFLGVPAFNGGIQASDWISAENPQRILLAGSVACALAAALIGPAVKAAKWSVHAVKRLAYVTQRRLLVRKIRRRAW
jgi:hypothetical protein